ncbi:MAG: RNA methyltransferase [Bacteroidota bacterium]
MADTITSTQNPLVKKILQLKDKGRERKKTGLFVIEGLRELQLALKGGYALEKVFCCQDLSGSSEIQELLLKKIMALGVSLSFLSRAVYEKVAYRGSTEGIIAIAQSKSHDLDTLTLSNCPLILVAEAPEKPGNIGALLRTADAAGLDGVIIADPRGDLYNPNIIRSSVGCLFTTPVVLGSTSDIIDYLSNKNMTLFCASLEASKDYTSCNFTIPSAIAVGTESTGLSKKWRENANERIIIPMRGEIDSMNVSVSAAILIFEALRQRGL